jgi:hypothetical protein
VNTIDGGALLGTLALWVAGAIALATVTTYFVRARVRAVYPGGNGRYLAALIVQSTAFMAPIPIVLVLMSGVESSALSIALALLAGFGVLTLLHFLPVTGSLLRDLRKAQIDAAMNRGGRS